MKILVTGGAGFIGAYLVKRLVKLGHDVTVVDNFSRGLPERLNSISQKIDLQNIDLRTDFKKLEMVSSGIDLLYHLAAVNGTENFYSHSDLVLDVGVLGMLNVLNSTEKNSIENLIVASSAEVYQTAKIIPTPESAELIIPDPLEPRYSYAASKIITEQLTLAYLRSKRINNAIVFRPHNVYGPDMGFKHVVPQFLQRAFEIQKTNFSKEFEIYGNGKETRAFCYVDDIVDGLILLKDKGKSGEIYHIGNDHEITINELFDVINQHFQNKLVKVFLKGFSGATNRRCPEITKMKKIGYAPQISISEGIERTFNYYKDIDFKNISNKLV
tara:strand:+ start:101 stop:1084 length:984 start_codon:yes stop_codon:yes gene_type:complete